MDSSINYWLLSKYCTPYNYTTRYVLYCIPGPPMVRQRKFNDQGERPKPLVIECPDPYMHIHLCMQCMDMQCRQNEWRDNCQPASHIHPRMYQRWMNGSKIPNHSLSLFEFHLFYFPSWWCIWSGSLSYPPLLCKLSLDGILSSVRSSRSSLLVPRIFVTCWSYSVLRYITCIRGKIQLLLFGGGRWPAGLFPGHIARLG